LLGALAFGFYVLYNIVQGIKATGKVVNAAGQLVADAYTSTRDALTNDLYILFGPDDAKALGSMAYLTVNFPDGRHAVPANTVTDTGLFQWTGFPPGSQPLRTLQLVKDDKGAWYATAEEVDFGVTNPSGW